MNKKKHQPWEPAWDIQRDIGSGGQGTTKLVKNSASGELGCLKTLNNNKDEERRKRFRRESVALQTLEHVGIPKFLASNSELFESQEKLFLISEYVDGITLGEKIDNDVMDLASTIAMGKRLAQILEYCHSEGEVHRDIKPDNIVLRNEITDQPVLVDFGLSFNKDHDDSSLTEAGQHIGNRSLILPELLPGSSNRRNPISDLSQLSNVLLFALTGHHATTLMNEDGLPHQRPHIRALLNSSVPVDKLNILLNLFDVSFTLSTNERIQNARLFQEHLIKIEEGGGGQLTTTQDRLAAITSRVKAVPALRKKQEGKILLEVARKKISEIVWTSLKNTGVSASRGDRNTKDNKLEMEWHLYPEGENLNFSDAGIFIYAELIGGEVAVSAKPKLSESIIQIGRINIDDVDPNYAVIEPLLIDTVVRAIETELMPEINKL